MVDTLWPKCHQKGWKETNTSFGWDVRDRGSWLWLGRWICEGRRLHTDTQHAQNHPWRQSMAAFMAGYLKTAVHAGGPMSVKDGNVGKEERKRKESETKKYCQSVRSPLRTLQVWEKQRQVWNRGTICLRAILIWKKKEKKGWQQHPVFPGGHPSKY